MKYIKTRTELLLFVFLIFSLNVSAVSHKVKMQNFIYGSSVNGTKTIFYGLYVPDNYDSLKKYPLVLFLHGAGGSGNNSDAVKQQLYCGFADSIFQKDHPCFVLIPICPNEEMYWEKSPTRISAKLIVDHIISTYSIDANRVSITGLSAGGYGTWEFLAYYSNFFSAAMPLCCGYWSPNYISTYQGMPIWMHQGQLDVTCPVSGMRLMSDYYENIKPLVYTRCSRNKNYNMNSGDLIKLVNSNVDYLYTEYQFAGHNVWDSAYSDTTILRWLISKRKRNYNIINFTDVNNNININGVLTLGHSHINSGNVRLKYTSDLGYSWTDVLVDSTKQDSLYVNTINLTDCARGKFKIELYDSSGVFATAYSPYYNINNQETGRPFLTLKNNIELVEIGNDSIPVDLLAIDTKNEPLQLNVYYKSNNGPDSLIQSFSLTSSYSYRKLNIFLKNAPVGTNVRLKFALSNNNYTVYDSTRRFILTHNAKVLQKKVIWDKQTREYTLYVPKNYDKNKKTPLVFVLHGYREHPADIIRNFQFNTLAEKDTAILVYPQALSGTTSWGLGPAIMWNAEWGMKIDDIGFVNYLIDRIYTDYNIDLSRVYATGLAIGGYMSYMMGAKLSDRISAIASVETNMNYTIKNNIASKQKLSVLHIHSENNSDVPFLGVSGWAPSIPDLMSFLAANDECNSAPIESDLPNINTNDSSTVTKVSYNNCKNNTDVILYKIKGGHDTYNHWPQGLFDPAGNKDINATELIWDFFKNHHLENPKQGTNVDVQSEYLKYANDVYPNPGNGIYLFKNKDIAFDQLSVTDLTGKKIININNYNSSDPLDISEYKQGLYILRIVDKQRSYSYKLIKN